MTEFCDIVDRQQLKIEAEEWGRRIKYYHYNNGVRTIEFNNGNKLIENTKDDKVRVVTNTSKESLIDRMLTAWRDGKW